MLRESRGFGARYDPSPARASGRLSLPEANPRDSSSATFMYNDCWGPSPANRREAMRKNRGGKMSNKSLKNVRFKKVGDVMSKDVVFIDGNETVTTAIATMRNKKVSSLVVNRRTPEDAWGIVTRKDIVSEVVDPGRDPKDVKVFEIMTKPLVMVSKT